MIVLDSDDGEGLKGAIVYGGNVGELDGIGVASPAGVVGVSKLPG